jgi:hypothetical protein
MGRIVYRLSVFMRDEIGRPGIGVPVPCGMSGMDGAAMAGSENQEVPSR